MKRIQLSLLAFALALMAAAQAPQAIKYQSVVRDNAGVELTNQNVGFRISVLQGSSSGPVVYAETHTISTNAFGLANFNIGTGTVLSGDFNAIDWGADTYFFKVDLDASGGTNYQFIGTSQALSVPYALHARTADSVSGGGQWNTNGDDLHNANTGNVGIGITTPEQKLDVQGSAIVRGEGFNGVGDSAALYLGDTFSRVKNTFGTGVQFYAYPGTTPAMTIHTGENNVGIGTSLPASALHIAKTTAQITLTDTDDNTSAYMLPPDPSTGGTGGFGVNGGDLQLFTEAGDAVTITNATGDVGVGTATPGAKLDVNGTLVSRNYTLLTTTLDSTGGNVGATYAYSNVKLATVSDQEFTFYAWDQSGDPENFAGYFIGNVAVTGSLAKGSGSFKIDHPLDPANKFLYHSFVESPDMMNVYNGNVLLDANGNASVVLPDYFQALNKEYRYQLTPVGAPGAGLYVSREVENGSFGIAGGAAGAKVSWQVTGIRQDAFANQQRIPNSVDKKGREVGHYLHPTAFGLDASKAINYVNPVPAK